MTKDYISIIMPVKNVEKYINLCIDSILNQTYENYEFIIVDSSSDHTSDIINSYRDKRIKHILLKGNISQAINYGISISNYNIICRMDGDDFCKAERLEHQLKFLLANKGKVDILGCNLIHVNEYNNELLRKKYPESDKEIKFYMPVFTSIPHPAIMTYKSTLSSINCYNENYTKCEDLDLFLRLISRRYKFYNLQEYLYFYRYRKDIDFISPNSSKNKDLSYSLGKKYLDSLLNSDINNEINTLRLGLLEYYKGSLFESRKYFRFYLKRNPKNLLKYFKYYFVSSFPENIIYNLRRIGIPQAINRFLLRYLKFESQFLSLGSIFNSDNKEKHLKS